MLVEDYHDAVSFLASGKIVPASKWVDELAAKASASSFGGVG